MAEELDPDELAKELARVARAIVSHTVRDADGWGTRAPLLEALVAKLRSDDDARPVDALYAVLDGVLGDYQHEPMPTKFAARYGPPTRLLFGLTEVDKSKLPPDAPKTAYGRAVWKALSDARIGETETRRRNEFTAEVRRRMAEALIAAVEQKRPGEEQPPGQLAVVHRPDVLNRVRRRLEGPDRLCLLWGESGNGKTFLARQLIDTMSPALKVAHLRGPYGADAEHLHRDIDKSLAQLGVSAPPTKFAAESRLRRHLAEGHFDLLVIDDADSQLVDMFVDPAVPTLLTRTSVLREIPSKLRVRLSTWDENQSKRYLHVSRPELTPAQRASLATLLGGRALPLSLAVRALQSGHLSADELLHVVSVDVVKSIDFFNSVADSPKDYPVVALYDALLHNLASHPDSLRLLDCLIWLLPGGYEGSPVALPDVFTNGALAGMRYRAALAQLISFGLIEGVHGAIQMNDLTRDILRRLRPDSLRWVASEVLEPVVAAERLLATADWFTKNEAARNEDYARVEPLQPWFRDSTMQYFAQAFMTAVTGSEMPLTVELNGLERLVTRDEAVRDHPLLGDSTAVFLEKREVSLVHWSDDGKRRVLEPGSDEFLLYSHFVAACYAYMRDAVLARGGVAPEEPDCDSIPQLHVSPTDGLQHSPVTEFGERGIHALGGFAWTRCGRLFGGPRPGDSDGKRCTKCERAWTGSQTEVAWQRVLWSVVYVIRTFGTVSAHWRLASAACQALMAVTPAPDLRTELLIQALGFVGIGESSENWNGHEARELLLSQLVALCPGVPEPDVRKDAATAEALIVDEYRSRPQAADIAHQFEAVSELQSDFSAQARGSVGLPADG